MPYNIQNSNKDYLTCSHVSNAGLMPQVTNLWIRAVLSGFLKVKIWLNKSEAFLKVRNQEVKQHS